MNRLKMALATLLALSFSTLARAAADPVSIEVKWQVKTFSISTTGVTSAIFDIGGFGAAGAAILGNTAKFNGVDSTTYGANSVVTSTWTNIVGFGYSILPIGGNANFTISQTLKMPSPNGTGIFGNTGNVFSSSTYNTPYPASNFFTVPVISTSSTITVPNGVPFGDSFTAQVANPVFNFSGLTAAATLYFSFDYGVPRAQ